MGRSKRQSFILAMELYVTINPQDTFQWKCTQGVNKGKVFRITCHNNLWEGWIKEDYHSSHAPQTWKRIEWRFYNKKDSIEKGIKFYKDNK